MKTAAYTIIILGLFVGSCMLLATQENPVLTNHHVWDTQPPPEQGAAFTLRPRTIVSWGSRAYVERAYPGVYHSTPACTHAPSGCVPMRTTHYVEEGWRPCPYCKAERPPCK